MLKYILLGFLNYQPMTGYDLKRLIDNTTAHFWHAYHSQIYTTLRKMEQDGLVVSVLDDSDEKLERRIYEITDQGQTLLKQWLEHSLTELPSIKDDLLVRLFFSGTKDSSGVLDELKLQRQLHRQKLQIYQLIKPEECLIQFQLNSDRVNLELESKFWLMTLKHGLAYEQMYLQWLDETIAEIESW